MKPSKPNWKEVASGNYFKQVYLVLLALILIISGCGSKDFQSDYFTIQRALSGNQLLLINGYKVTLIGIEDNHATQEYLSQNMQDRRVRFFFDSKSPMYQISPYDPEMEFYAYVMLEDGSCLNSFLLKNQYSLVPRGEYYLNDSLDQYLAYTSQSNGSRRSDREENLPISPRTKGPEEVPHHSRDIKPPTDPRENMIRYNGCDDLMKMIAPAVDYTSPVVRNLGVTIARLSEGMFNIGQVCEVFKYVRTNWSYVNDPKGIEYFAKASQTIQSTQLSGDCDDYAILLYSLITAIGGDARIIFSWGPNGGHAFTEVDITNMDFKEIERAIINSFSAYEISSIHYQIDADGNKWLNLDWWAAHPGGKYLDYDTYMIFYPRQDICLESD